MLFFWGLGERKKRVSYIYYLAQKRHLRIRYSLRGVDCVVLTANPSNEVFFFNSKF